MTSGDILHRPGEKAGKPSILGKEYKALAAVNAGYFHVKSRTPSVYFRIGDKVYGTTHPTETYRVDGVLGFKDKEGKEMSIAYADTTQYQSVAGDWHTVMASGPMLVVDGEIAVPLLMGDNADGDNVAAMQVEQKTGVINYPYDNKQWDHEGERAVPNLIVAY